MTSELLGRVAAEHNVPALVVGASRQGEQLFSYATTGLAGVAPPAPTDVFSLASVSKPITATAVMLLVDRGAIDLDRPINDYLDQPLVARIGDARNATVRTLANHTSGLPMHFRQFYADEDRRVPSKPELIRRYGFLMSAPGERLRYSNLGYGVLEHVVSLVSGQPFDEFLTKELFQPLGMLDTWVGLPPGGAPVTARYAPDGSIYPSYVVDNDGAAGIWSTAADLLRFGAALMTPPSGFLSPSAVDEMWRTTTTVGTRGIGYAVGWCTAGEFGLRTVSHTGGMAGVTTFLHLVPAERMAVVALSNSGSIAPLLAVGHTLASILPKYERGWSGLARPETLFIPDVANLPFAETIAELRPAPEFVGLWSGTVSTCEGERATVVEIAADGRVSGQIGDESYETRGLLSSEPGALAVRVAASIPTVDTTGHAHQTVLELTHRGNRLTGSAMAVPHLPEGESAKPGRRYGNGLSHWVELSR